MRPLAVAAGGVVLVALDFRTEALDLLPDPLGWALIALAASWLALPAVTRLAAVTGLLSLADVALPYHYVRIDPLTGERLAGPARGNPVSVRLDYLPLEGTQLALLAAAVVGTGATLWMLLGRLRRRADYEEDEHAVSRLRRAQWAVAGAWVAPYLVTLALAAARDGRYDPVWNHGYEYLGLLGLGTGTYVVAVLAGSIRASWAQRPGSWYPSPWDELRLRAAARRMSRRSTST
ncbi:MAG TPA: hypothetical protein VKB57_06435 [Acidimicrobiales bacterium]|nr:hypothetical protein [Acidimicrobiales bacterium]